MEVKDAELRAAKEQQLAVETKDDGMRTGKASQLSVELLTNVTHDLKTPLTAITELSRSWRRRSLLLTEISQGSYAEVGASKGDD